MKTGRIIGIFIVASGILTLYYMEFDDEFTGFLVGLLTGVGVLLIIKGRLKNPLKN